MKRFLSIVAVAIMTCGMIFATGCSKAPKCKQALDSVLTAESFTVSVDDDVVFKFTSDKMYLKDGYENGKFDAEYYFTYSENGKNLAYSCDSNSVQWEKKVLSNEEYFDDAMWLGVGLGLDEDLIYELRGISLNFGNITKQVGDEYILKDTDLADDISKIWAEGDAFCFIFKGYGADKKDVEVRVTDINKTKIIIPAEVTGGAKPVNNISLS